MPDSPLKNELVEFLLGNLADDRRAAIERQLQDDPDLAARLDELAGVEDSLVQQIREQWAGAQYRDEPFLQQAMDQLLQSAATLAEIGEPQTPARADQPRSPASPDSPTSAAEVTYAFQSNVETSRSGNQIGGTPKTLERLGRYRIESVIGQGGMGAVYLAHDEELDRKVALKIPFVNERTAAAVLERFRREARAAAAMQHRNICSIYDVGEYDGQPYLTMAYIQGETLSAWRGQGRSPEEILVVARKVASALQQAHDAGIIHRDLKPSNIMIDRDGEPVVMDFGLARRDASGDEQLTHSGQIMGTPAYMAPEQVAGRSAEMGPGCDIYALGVILYELLCGQRPFEGDLIALVRQIALESPRSLRELNDQVSPELDRLVLKALEKQPADRYASMREFAQALKDYQQAEPSAVAPAPRPAFEPGPDPSHASSPRAAGAAPPLRKKRSILLACAGLPLVLLLGVVLFSLRTPHGEIVVELGEGIPAEQAKNIKIEVSGEGELKVADAAAGWSINVKEGKYQAQLAGGSDRFQLDQQQVTVTRGEKTLLKVSLRPARTTPSAEVSVPVQPTLQESERSAWQPGPAEGALPGLVQRPAALPGIGRWQLDTRRPRGETGPDWSPDGSLIAIGTDAGEVRLLDAQTLDLVRVLPHPGSRVNAVRWHPSGDRLAAGTLDGHVLVLAADGRLLHRIRASKDHISTLDWSDDGERLAAGGHEGHVRVWTAAGEPVLTLPVRGSINAVRFLGDGRLAAAGWGRTVWVWNSEGRELQSVSLPEEVSSLDRLGDGRLILGLLKGLLYTLDPDTAEVAELGRIKGDHWNRVTTRPDGRGFLAATNESLYLYDGPFPDSGRRLSDFAGVTTWSPDGERFVARRYSLFIGEVGTGKIVSTVKDGSSPIAAVVATRAGDRLAVSLGRTDVVLGLQTDGSRPSEIVRHRSGTLDWHPEGRRLAAAGTGLSVIGEQPAWTDRDARPHRVRWSPDGRTLAVTESGNPARVRLFAADGTPGATIPAEFSRVAWSPDGRLAVPTREGIALFTSDGTGLGTLPRPVKDSIEELTWSPGGDWIASASSLGVVLLDVDSAGSRRLPNFEGQGTIRGLAWNRSGGRLAAGTDSGAVPVWTAAGQLLRVVRHPDQVPSDAIDWLDDRRMLTGCHDGVLRLWDVETGDLLQMIVVVVGPDRAPPRTFTVSAAGEVLQAEGIDVEKELVYTVEDEDGRLELLTPSEFHQRIAAGKAAASPAGQDGKGIKANAAASPATSTTPPAAPAPVAWQPVPIGQSAFDNLDPQFIPAEDRLPGQPEELVAVVGSRQNHHWYEVNWLDWSPDGQRMASVAHDRGNLRKGVSERYVRIWNAETLAPIMVVPTPDGSVAIGCAFVGSGDRLAVSGRDAIWLCDLSGKAPKFIPWGGPGGPMTPPGGSAQSLRCSDDGATLVGAVNEHEFDPQVKVWDLSGTSPRLRYSRRVELHVHSISPVDVSRDGKRVVYHALKPNRLVVVDLSERDAHQELVIELGEAWPVCCAISPDGRTLAAGLDKQIEIVVELYGIAENRGVEKHSLPIDGSNVVHILRFSPDGRRLAVRRHLGLRVFQLDGGEATQVGGELFMAGGMAFAPDSGRLVRGTGDFGIVRIDVAGDVPRLLDDFPRSRLRLVQTQLASARGWLPAVTLQSKSQLWDFRGTRPRLTAWLDPEESIVRTWDTYLAPDGEHLLELNGSKSRWLAWSPAGFRASQELSLVDVRRDSFIGSRGLSLVKFDDAGAPWSLWDIGQPPETAKPLVGLELANNIRSVALSPDGRWLAVDGDEAELWDISGSSARRSAVLLKPDSWNSFLRFSPDGRLLAILDPRYDLMTMYDLSKPQPELVAAPIALLSHQSDAAFTPDGRRLVVSSQTGTLASYDLEQGSKVWETQLPGAIRSLAVADDGRHIVTGNGDGTAYVLRVPDLLTRPAPHDYRVDPAAERRAAEWAVKLRPSRLTLKTLEGRYVGVNDGQLPDEPFYIHALQWLNRDLDDDALAGFRDCRRIASLDLAENPRLTDAALEHFSGVNSLEGIRISRTGIGDGLAALVRRSPQLKRLILEQSKVTNALLPALGDCPQLERVELPDQDPPIDLREVARYCPNLRELTLPPGARVQSPDALPAFPRLNFLFCGGDFLQGAAGDVLPSTNLRRIAIAQPTDDTLQRLVGILPQFGNLALHQKSPTGRGLTAASYRSLAKAAGPASGLLVLRLQDTDIAPSDDDLMCLAELPALRILELWFAANERHYTPAGLQAFADKRPDVQLTADGARIMPQEAAPTESPY